MSDHVSHDVNRLINTAVDAFGRPLNTLATMAPSWFSSPRELRVEVSDTPKSSLEKDSAIAKQMAFDGHSKEEVKEYLEEHSKRMQGLETKEQKSQYFETLIQGAYQAEALNFAKEKGLDLSVAKEISHEKTL